MDAVQIFSKPLPEFIRNFVEQNDDETKKKEDFSIVDATVSTVSFLIRFAVTLFALVAFVVLYDQKVIKNYELIALTLVLIFVPWGSVVSIVLSFAIYSSRM
jgi:hypothetical protein